VTEVAAVTSIRVVPFPEVNVPPVPPETVNPVNAVDPDNSCILYVLDTANPFKSNVSEVGVPDLKVLDIAAFTIGGVAGCIFNR
jgi:hypothetical protein